MDCTRKPQSNAARLPHPQHGSGLLMIKILLARRRGVKWLWVWQVDYITTAQARIHLRRTRQERRHLARQVGIFKLWLEPLAHRAAIGHHGVGQELVLDGDALALDRDELGLDQEEQFAPGCAQDLAVGF